MSEAPLIAEDTAAIMAAINTARAEGRIVEAVEVNPRRRLLAGAWDLPGGVRLVSNGLVPLDRFELKLRGAAYVYDTLGFDFRNPAMRRPADEEKP